MNPIITAFDKGIKKSRIRRSRVCVASDIPFKPQIVSHLGIDFYHTIRGRTIAFGTGLKLANPKLKVVAFAGDLMTIGGNHFVHGGRRNMDLLVICVTNFIFPVIGGKKAPSVPVSFSAYSTFEQPFNIPHLANSCGAVYTARWTALHIDELAVSIGEALNRKGFSVIEVISPGPNFYKNIQDIDSDLLNFYFNHSERKDGENPKEVGITAEDKIIVGKFVDKERMTFLEVYNDQLEKTMGDKFIPYGE
jgi:2-oxoglutarate ferredoxin oxidoreductase subunit beta